MSKFNETAESKSETINYMGAKAVKNSPELELVSVLLTSFIENSYYEKQTDLINRLKDLISKCDKKFVAQAAVYARTKFGMRSITHVVAAELAKHVSGKDWAKDFYSAVIHRPDDMLEISAYYRTYCAEVSDKSKVGKKSLSGAMKKGFAIAMEDFNAYELAKYRGESKDIKMIDLVNQVHPRASVKNGEAISELVKGTLKSVDTWETALTKAGQKATNDDELAEFKKEAWTKLIAENKIGIFAVLRNLRNIMQQAPEVLSQALEILTDKQLILKSLILPFRYLTAYNEIEKLDAEKVFEKDTNNVKMVLEAIEKAVMLSIENLPVLDGKTIILSDNSGSMRGDRGGSSLTSRLSNTKTSDIANLFALLYWLKADNTMVGLFGDRLIHPTLDRSKGLFDNFKFVDKAAGSCGASTERGIFDMFEKLIKEKIIANTIVIFSDCQIGDGCNWYDDAGNKGHDFFKLFTAYKKINPDFRCYSVDLKGYGTTVFDGSVIKMSGWSEKIFEIMKFAEQDKNALINEIKKVSFKKSENNFANQK